MREKSPSCKGCETKSKVKKRVLRLCNEKNEILSEKKIDMCNKCYDAYIALLRKSE